MTHHHLHSSDETCHWGFFEARLKPVLTIASGDEVTIDTISGGPDAVPDKKQFHVPPEMAEVHAKSERMLPGHILTGPVAVEGALPGDVLEVEILEVQLRQDWGWNLIRPLAGTLPDDFHETRLLNIPLDRERMVGRMPWGLELPLAPFFGVMGVAPPPAWGRITSLIPRAMGGNLDNKELGAGAKLYLPVFVPGALFSCGDGHGIQGDGEVCVTAIETALTGRFRLTLRKDLKLAYPRAETPSHYMTMAMDPDLDQCVVRALRDMIVLLGEKRNLSREDAYMLCSLAADLRVTQTVNGSKGIHCMIAKSVVHGCLGKPVERLCPPSKQPAMSLTAWHAWGSSGATMINKRADRYEHDHQDIADRYLLRVRQNVAYAVNLEKFDDLFARNIFKPHVFVDPHTGIPGQYHQRQRHKTILERIE